MNPYEKPANQLLASNGRSYYAGLDGLRGIAIFLILGYHIFSFIPFFAYGWLGVDLFFVLSGFLITDILLKTRDNDRFLRNFYIRRVLRIFPIYYLTLIIFILVLPALKEVPYNANYYSEHQLKFWLYLCNWLFILKSPEETFFLNHLWSLAIEQQYYFIWPWFLLVITNTKKLIGIVFGLLGLLILLRVLLWYFNPTTIDFGLLYKFSRVDGLFIGSALAVYLYNHPRIESKYITRILTFLILFNAAFIFTNSYLDLQMNYFLFVGYTSFAILFGLLVHHIITHDKNKWICLFHHPALIFLGKISYGFYLYHWPIYLLFFSGIKAQLHDFLPTGILLTEFLSACIITIMAMGVSLLSYLLIEKNFMKLKHIFN